MKKILLLLLLPIVHANTWLPQTSSAPCAPGKNSTWTLKTYPCTPQTSSTAPIFCCLPHETCQISTTGRAQCLPELTNNRSDPPRPANCSGMAECPLFCMQDEFVCGRVCCPNGKACISDVCFENLPAKLKLTTSTSEGVEASSLTPPPASAPAVSRVPAKKTTVVSGKVLTAVLVVIVLLVVIALGIAGCVCLVRRRRQMERVRNSPAKLRGFPIVGYVSNQGGKNGVGEWVDVPLPGYSKDAEAGEVAVWK